MLRTGLVLVPLLLWSWSSAKQLLGTRVVRSPGSPGSSLCCCRLGRLEGSSLALGVFGPWSLLVRLSAAVLSVHCRAAPWSSEDSVPLGLLFVLRLLLDRLPVFVLINFSLSAPQPRPDYLLRAVTLRIR